MYKDNGSLDQKLKDYFSSITRIQNSINSLNGNTLVENHKTTLLYNLIDLLSLGVYGHTPRNGERFRNFINNYCDWDDSLRVSLPQVYLAIKQSSNEDFNELMDYVHNNLSEWPLSSPIKLEKDPCLDSIECLFPKKDNGSYILNPKSFTHCNLLWKSRNSIIHEMRPISEAWNLFDMLSPYYVPKAINAILPEGNLKQAHSQIYYPIEFLNQLIITGANNLRTYYIDNERDPYLNHMQKDLW